jgi:hypothetical protein
MLASIMGFTWGEGSFISKDMHHNIRSNSVSTVKAMVTEQKTAQKRLNVANAPKITKHMSITKIIKQ